DLAAGTVRPGLLGKPRRRPGRPRKTVADPPPTARPAAADPGPRRPGCATIDEPNVRCGLSPGKSLVGGRWAPDRACPPVPRDAGDGMAGEDRRAQARAVAPAEGDQTDRIPALSTEQLPSAPPHTGRPQASKLS